MSKRTIIIFFMAVLTATLPSRAEVIYTRAPLPPAPDLPVIFGASQSVDFDSNGVPEIVFSFGGALCTMDVPTSFCSYSFFVGATGSNQFLLDGAYSAALSLGETIGSATPETKPWSPPGNTAYLTTLWWSLNGRNLNGDVIHSGWTGPLSEREEGFLGVRFYLADGIHYGWIRLRLDVPGWVVDWAYESEPDTPILAGAGIDDDHDGVWDLVDQCPNTPEGEVVNADGCSISQLVPCDGPWRNHGEYVVRVARAVMDFRKQGLVSPKEAKGILHEAAKSDCGKRASPKPRR